MPKIYYITYAYFLNVCECAPALMRLHLYVRAILVKNLKSLVFIYKLKIFKKKKK